MQRKTTTIDKIEEEEIEIEEETEESRMFNSIKSEAHKLIGILYNSYSSEELKNIRQLPDLLTNMINISEILKPWTAQDSQYRSEAAIVQIGLLLSRGTLLMLSKESRAKVLAELLYQEAQKYSPLFLERKNPYAIEALRLYPLDIKDRSAGIGIDLPNWLYTYYNGYCRNDNNQEIIQTVRGRDAKREPGSVDAAHCHEEMGKFYQKLGRNEEAYHHLIAARDAYRCLNQKKNSDRVNRKLNTFLLSYPTQSFFPAIQDAERLPESQRNKIESENCCRIL